MRGSVRDTLDPVLNGLGLSSSARVRTLGMCVTAIGPARALGSTLTA